MSKGDEIFGLLKIPDSVLLKNALIEIGQLKSYIEELEEKLKMKEPIKAGSIEALMHSNETLRKHNKKLREEIRKIKINVTTSL